MKIEIEFDLGETVVLKHDKERVQRMITGVVYRPMGLLYYCSSGTIETIHYPMEIEKAGTCSKNVAGFQNGDRS